MPCISVAFRLFVPASFKHGWYWTPWSIQDPVATEELTSLEELPRVLRSTARAAAPLVSMPAGDRFQVTAYGAKSGRPYGRDVWIWDPEVRLFRAHGSPLVVGVTELSRTRVGPATGHLVQAA